MTVSVVVYTITGKQLFLKVSPRLCEECDLTVQAVREAVREEGLNGEVQVQVRPWLNHLPRALAVGGWHPPVVVIDGKVYTQGVVPPMEALRSHLRRRASG